MLRRAIEPERLVQHGKKKKKNKVLLYAPKRNAKVRSKSLIPRRRKHGMKNTEKNSERLQTTFS